MTELPVASDCAVVLGRQHNQNNPSPSPSQYRVIVFLYRKYITAHTKRPCIVTMPGFSRGIQQDWDEEGSERSSNFTDEAGYQSSNDGPRRSLADSAVASNDDRRRPSHGNEETDDREDTTRNPYSAYSSIDRERAVGSIPERGGIPHQAEREVETTNFEPTLDSSAAESTADAYRSRFQSGRTVDFASEVPQNLASHATFGPGPYGRAVETGLENVRMGPPLSRALLIQSSGEGSLKSYGSDDGQNMAHDVAGMSPFHSSTASNSSQLGEMIDTAAVLRSRPRRGLSHSAGDTFDEISQAGNDMDDCECSLDVETHSVHSVGTRSVYSQEDASLLPRLETATIHDVPAFEARRMGIIDDDLDRRPHDLLDSGDGEPTNQEPLLEAPMKSFQNDDSTYVSTLVGSDEQGRISRWNREHEYRQRSLRQRSRSRSPSHGSRAVEDDVKSPAHQRNREFDDWDERRET